MTQDYNAARVRIMERLKQEVRDGETMAQAAVRLLAGWEWAASTVTTQLSRNQGPGLGLLNDLGDLLFPGKWLPVERPAKRKPGPPGPRAPEPKLCVVAGDAGVYVGLVMGGAEALTASGVVVLTRSRHLRRYYVMGCAGDGSVTDLAALGLDQSSPSVTAVLEPATALRNVYRVLEVAPAAAPSFGVL